MRLIIIFSLSLFATLSQFSTQAQHQCAHNKQNFFNSTHSKKSRAANSDNALMIKYDVHHYKLDIACENNSLFVSGNATINAKVLAALDTFAFELHSNHTIDSVLVDGQKMTFINKVHMHYVPVPTIAVGNNISVQIFYHGTCPTGGNAAIGDGYSTKASGAWSNKVSWSLSQPYVAYEWWPCKQFLTDKADSDSVSITTADTNKAGSNGLLLSVDTLPNNKLKFNWHTTQAINYYLISVAVAGYVDYSFYAHPSNMVDSILIQNYIYNNPLTLPNFKKIIDTTALQMEKFCEKIIPYPFAKEKYGHCMAPFSGGMEHQTMTSLGFFNFDLISHELMHQWFGDHVTCSTWKDIFVNEGFATYGEYLAREMIYGVANANIDMKSTHNRIKSQAGGSVYFTDTTDGNRIFSSRLTYDKGGAILHTLRFIIGDSAFFKTLQDFQNKYAFGNASAEEFRQVAETVSGKNLSDWMNQWFYGEGYPIYNAIFNSNGSNVIINLKHITSTGITTKFTNPVQIRLVSPLNGDSIITVPVTSNNEFFVIPTTKTIANLVIDPNNWVIDSTSSITKNPDLFALDILDNSVNSKMTAQIQPNPVQDFLNITCSTQLESIQVVDINGRVVLDRKLNGISAKLNINALSVGIYSCLVTDSNGNKQVVKFSKL
jgi:aminopeptidase N